MQKQQKQQQQQHLHKIVTTDFEISNYFYILQHCVDQKN